MKNLRVLLSAGALITASLGACTPAADESAQAGAETPTPRNPFFGVWDVSATRVAPWWDGQGDEPLADPGFGHLVLDATSTSGPPVLTCDKPTFTTDIMPLRGLFEGLLPEPALDAAALGLTDPNPAVLTLACTSGGADVEARFVMVDADTILLGMDNVIYTYTRSGS